MGIQRKEKTSVWAEIGKGFIQETFQWNFVFQKRSTVFKKKKRHYISKDKKWDTLVFSFSFSLPSQLTSFLEEPVSQFKS